MVHLDCHPSSAKPAASSYCILTFILRRQSIIITVIVSVSCLTFHCILMSPGRLPVDRSSPCISSPRISRCLDILLFFRTRRRVRAIKRLQFRGTPSVEGSRQGARVFNRSFATATSSTSDRHPRASERPSCSASMTLIEDVVQMVHTAYGLSKFVVPSDRWTVLACFTLVKADRVKVISIATGSRCLPAEKLESTGCVLFDCHAEVLSRRGAVRWFLEEAQRMQGGYDSDWLESSSCKKARLKPDVKVYLYVSTIPCRSSNLPTRRLLIVP
jgi:hypothetical protein